VVNTVRAALIVACVLLAMPAIAQEETAAQARAQALFKQGREWMEQGQYARACPVLEESLEIHHGVGIQFNLAACYEHIGRYASALTAFRAVLEATVIEGQAKREAIVREKIAALEPRTLKLVIAVTQPIEGLVVRRSGRAVPQSDWGTEQLIDPGSYLLDANAPGRKPWSSTVQPTGEGTVFTVHVPVLQPLETVVAPPAPVAPEPTDDSGDSMIGTIGTVGLVVAGVGVVGIVAGAIAGGIAVSKKGDVEPICADTLICSDADADVLEGAQSAGNISTALFVVGGLVAAGGVTMWLLAPSDGEQIAVGMTPGGLVLRGSF
jgi:hypothetical protein